MTVRLRLRARALGLAAVLALGACTPPATTPAGPVTDKHAPSSGATHIRPTGLLGLLERVEVREVPWVQGYTRSAYGLEWTDAYDGPFGRNGCDTRQDVLLQQMTDIEMRWGSSCRIYQARLVDPYSGEAMTWRDDGYWIEIDHVYPLARSWDAGASSWSQARRVRFANDVRRNLLAVSHRANQDKGAQTLGEWLPPAAAYHCTYARKYLRVALAWQLPITPADAETVLRLARRCD